MAQSATGPSFVKVTGETLRAMTGVAGGSGTSTTVTLPGHMRISHVLVGGATSATAPYCDTITSNTFLVTHGNADLFVYLAFVKNGV